MLKLPTIFFPSLFYNFNIDSHVLKKFLETILKHANIILKTFVFGKESLDKQFETLNLD